MPRGEYEELKRENTALRARLHRLEEKDRIREDVERNGLAVKLARLDVEAGRIPESGFDEQVSHHNKKSVAILNTIIPYAEEGAKYHKKNARRQARARPSDNHISRYGADPNEPSMHDIEMIKRATIEFRRNLYE
ncbi:MAG: hypothetical protein MPJ05_07590 [Nitrosopumilus sp.]|nr:hypothetical protein [Nitrosopumilus sp.]